MKRVIVANGILWLLIGLLTALPPSTTAAAEKKAGTSKNSTTVKKTTKKSGKDEATKFKGRLPAHYGSVVDDKQRKEIYDIQAEYYNKLENLRKDHASQLKALMADRDEEITDLLTDEQRKKVAKLKADRSKSAKATSKKSSAVKKK